jgi:hypothetical protein
VTFSAEPHSLQKPFSFSSTIPYFAYAQGKGLVACRFVIEAQVELREKLPIESITGGGEDILRHQLCGGHLLQ